MSENREGNQPESEQALLASRLKTGKISPQEFLEEIWNLEQRTLPRDDAEANLKILTRPEVRALLIDSDDSDTYYNYLSRSYLHVAQRLGVENPEARRYLEQAFDTARNIADSEFSEWKLYLESYLAYLNKDRDRLSEISASVTGDNRAIVEDMLKKL